MRPEPNAEPEADAYAQPASEGALPRHAFLQPDVWQTVQERQRVMIRLFRELGWTDLSRRRVLEVGCGTGGNLLELLRMGFLPRHLKGIEIDEARHAHACEVLPSSLRLVLGDARDCDEALRLIPPGSQDIVLQATMFSSLLEDRTQVEMADAMWRWVRPGGGVLWYDFVVDNPANRQVRGVPVSRIQQLFPQARLLVRPVTLAPPLARWACRRHPSLYHLFNALPALRTHVLVWAAKPQDPPPPTLAAA